jgi:UDP-N-acetylmuramate--alanine ligase
MPGRHNAENALAAIVVLLDLGIDIEMIRKSLLSFEGIQRRFQRANIAQGVLVEDYAHHPREIMATLAAAHECWPDSHITAIFQPHRYTRTRDLMDEFMGAFDVANDVALLPVYAAGEMEIPDISSVCLRDGMVTRGHRGVSLVNDMEAARLLAQQELAAGHIVLLLGAGSIGALAQQMRDEEAFP